MIPSAANVALVWSAIVMPARSGGPSAKPVFAISPDAACTMLSIAGTVGRVVAVARDRAVHQARVDLRQLLVARARSSPSRPSGSSRRTRRTAPTSARTSSAPSGRVRSSATLRLPAAALEERDRQRAVDVVARAPAVGIARTAGRRRLVDVRGDSTEITSAPIDARRNVQSGPDDEPADVEHAHAGQRRRDASRLTASLRRVGAFGAQPLAQHELLDLAARRARELVDLADMLGPLLPREARLLERGAHRGQVGRGRRRSSMRKNAHPISPSRASGAATTATSATPGMRTSSSSTSAALTFSPPRMMMSFLRSVIAR